MSETTRQAPEPVLTGPSLRPLIEPAGPRPARNLPCRNLAAHPSLARQQIAHVGRRAGNAAVLSLLGGSGGANSALQRQPQPPAPAPGPGIAPPAPGPAPATPLPDFGSTTFIAGGTRFDLEYQPVGPLPKIGKVTAKLKIHVIFKDFDRTMMRRKEFVGHRWTRAQLRDMKWPEDQKAAWVGKFGQAVKDGWAGKRSFVLDQADFAKYRANFDVAVESVDDAAKANNTITAQWVPKDAPRIRSSVSGDTSELDVRDVDQTETRTVEPATIIRQIPGFEHNSAAISPDVETGVVAFEEQFRRQRQPGGPLATVPIADITVFAAGRSTRPGTRKHNKDLGSSRAQNVVDRVMDDLSLESGRAKGIGEENATDDPEFRRVDASIMVGGEREVTQNTAAHEAGHMFGLGDEYVEEAPKTEGVAAKFPGGQPSHYGDVKDTMGEDAANELLQQDGPSIMSSGSEVKPGHYVYFLQALNKVTTKTWKVE